MQSIQNILILALVLFNLLFFWELYTRPMTMATGELLSTFFPAWVWQGRQWAKWRIPKHEPYYWLNTNSHPVLSTYYPCNVISSLWSSILSLDKAFTLFVLSLGFHLFLCSIGWYLLIKPFGNLLAFFGAITFTYQAFHIRQQPCLVYTVSWFPWIAICPGLAIGMILLAGYYPLAIYLLPLGLLLNHDPIQWLIGLAIGSVQLVPFLRYLPKTIRANKQKAVETPPWEKPCYFGMIPLMLVSWRHLVLIPIAIVLYLITNKLPRVPWRSAIILTYLFIGLSLWHLSDLHLPPKAIWLLASLQCLDLWLHNRLIPTRPYCELYQVPSRVFNTKLVKLLESQLGNERVSGLPWPLFTGMINEFRTLGYNGGMQLKLMAKFRNDPDGMGNHDWFRSNEDDSRLEQFRVRFAYTGKRPDNWIPTAVRSLYRNPAV